MTGKIEKLGRVTAKFITRGMCSSTRKQSSRAASRALAKEISLGMEYKVRISEVYHDPLRIAINAIKFDVKLLEVEEISSIRLEVKKISSIRNLVDEGKVAILSWNHGDDENLKEERKKCPYYLRDNSNCFQSVLEKIKRINNSEKEMTIEYLIMDTVNQDIFGPHKEYEMQSFENLYHHVPIITCFDSDDYIKRPWITREMRSLKRNYRSSLDNIVSSVIAKDHRDSKARKKTIRKFGYTDQWFRLHKHLVKFHAIPFTKLKENECPINQVYKQPLPKNCIVTKCSVDVYRPESSTIPDDELYRYSSSELLKYDRPILYLLKEEEYRYHDNYLHANMDVFTRNFDEVIMRLYFDNRPVDEEGKFQRRDYIDSILTFLILVANKQVAVRCKFDLFSLLTDKPEYLTVRRPPKVLTRIQKDGVKQTCTYFECDLNLNYLRSDLKEQLRLFGLYDHDSKLYMFGLCSERIFHVPVFHRFIQLLKKKILLITYVWSQPQHELK
mmetsp:Transcript_34049/g.42031  ORF Transcript_34049/g.42031 Transcript_34049/m.42031 type:complete len:500 (+) Transcript_34049:567-2066(+)